MNYELHVIGSRNGFEKYPLDGLDNELKQCSILCRGNECLVISRFSERIVHYVYLRRIGKDGTKEFVGISLSFNGVYFRSVKEAFDVMEHLFNLAVYDGLIIHVTDNGYVEFNSQSFHDLRAQYNQLKKSSQRLIDSLPRNAIVTPSRSFHSGQGNTTANLEEGEENIMYKVEQYDRVVITRDASYLEVNDIPDRMAQLYKQNVELEKKYNEERKKKKQYSLVVVLLVVLILCGAVAAYIIRGDNFTISSLEQTVSQQETELSKK